MPCGINCPKWLCFLPTPRLCKAHGRSIIFPVSFSRELTLQQVQIILETIRGIDPYSCVCFQFYQDNSGSPPEELAGKQPLPFAPKKPREPLSFGMILLAVVLGIIIVSFL